MDELSVANWTVFGTFLLACILIVINYLRMRYGKGKFSFQLTDCMVGKPKWDFSTSWATTLTAVSALLSTVLAAGGLSHVESDTGLSLFFGMLVLIAPFAYNVIARYQEDSDPQSDQAIQVQGYVWVFLLTSLLTLWAVCGELVTVMHVLYKLENQNYLSSGVEFVFILLLAVTIICICLYALRSIPRTVKAQIVVQGDGSETAHPPHGEESRRREREPRMGEEERTPGPQSPARRRPKPPQETWALL
jgi:hypothetical protein